MNRQTVADAIIKGWVYALNLFFYIKYFKILTKYNFGLEGQC